MSFNLFLCSTFHLFGTRETSGTTKQPKMMSFINVWAARGFGAERVSSFLINNQQRTHFKSFEVAKLMLPIPVVRDEDVPAKMEPCPARPNVVPVGEIGATRFVVGSKEGGLNMLENFELPELSKLDKGEPALPAA